jgi:hypothetical protein
MDAAVITNPHMGNPTAAEELRAQQLGQHGGPLLDTHAARLDDAAAQRQTQGRGVALAPIAAAAAAATAAPPALVPVPPTDPNALAPPPSSQAPGTTGATGGTMGVAGKSTTVGPMLTYLKYYVIKTDNMYALTQFILTTVIILASLFVTAQSEAATDLATGMAAQHMLGDQFNAIQSAPDWYLWLEAVVDRQQSRIAGSGGSAAAERVTATLDVLLYGLSIDLYRVHNVSCDGRDDGARHLLKIVDPRRYRAGLTSPPCMPAYNSKHAVKSLPTPVLNESATDSIVQAAAAFAGYSVTDSSALRPGVPAKYCSVYNIRGRSERYYCDRASARVFIDAQSLTSAAGLGDVKTAIRELRDHGWLTQPDVRAVVVSAAMMHRGLQITAKLTSLLELSEGGSVQSRQETWTFALRSLHHGPSVRTVVAFILDILLVLAAVVCLHQIFFRVGLAMELNSRWTNAVDLWLALDTLVFGLIIAYCVERFRLWTFVHEQFPPPSGVDRADALGRVLSVAGRDETTRMIGAWLFLSLVFRTMYSLRYIGRTSLVFETIAASATDLVSTVVLAMTVVVAYALAGVLLWSTSARQFSSLGRAVLFLFNFMISVDVGNGYALLEETHPIVTTIFFVTLFLISWCVLMNVMVAVLATAFAAAATTQIVVRRPVWTAESLSRDLRSLAARMTESADGAPHPFLDEYQESLLGDNALVPTTPAQRRAAQRAQTPRLIMDYAGRGHFALGKFAKRELNPLLQVVLFGTYLRPNTLRTLHLIDRLREMKRKEGNDALITVEEACCASLFDPLVTSRMVTKAELHVGVSDASRRRWLIMQKLIRAEKDVSAQLSVQYRQLQELAETLCGAELGGDVATSSEDSDDDTAPGTTKHGDSADLQPRHNALESPLASSSEAERSLEVAATEPIATAQDAASSASSAPMDDSSSTDGGGMQGAGVVAREANVKRKQRKQRLQQRRAVHSTMGEVQQLLHAVERVSHQSQTRRATLASVVDVPALERLVKEYEELAASMGVVVI